MAFIKNTDTLVEGALQKFFTEQRAKDAVQPELSQLDSAILAEQSARQSADSALDQRLDVIEGSGEGSIAKSEQDAKDYADQKVAALVNSAPEVLNTLQELASALGDDPNFAVSVANQIGAVDDKVDQEISDRQAAVSAEQGRAQAAEQALDGRLDVIEGSGEGSVLKAKNDAKSYAQGLVSAEESARQSAVSAEQSARQSADSALSGRLDVLETDPTTKTYVDGKVTMLQGEISSEASARQTAVSGEASARQSADNALDGRLDVLESDPTTKTYVDGKVATEKTRAEGAESALSGRIASLEADPTTKSYVDGIQSALDGRLDALELDPVTKTYVDGEVSDLQGQITAEVSARQSAVSGEASARQSADQALDGRLDVLESDPTTKSYVDGEISSVEGQINQEISNRQSAVSGEQSRAEAAESALSGRINTEKGRVDAILSASQADKDSFAEIVSLINSVDAANDSAFAGYVLSNNAALAQEVSDRQAGDNALDARLDIIEGGESVSGSVAKALKDAKAYADSGISAEQTRAQGAESALDGRLDALEADPVTKSYVDSHAAAEESAREALESALDARLDALELDPVTKSYTDSELAKKVDVTTNYDIKPGLYQGGSKSANFQINWANGPFQQYTLGANCTVTFANPVSGGSYMLKLVQDGTGGRQITWPASVKWANGEAPTMSGASKIDFVQMVYDGTYYYGNYQLEDVTFAKSSELDAQVASLSASVAAEQAARQAEDATFFKLDGSRAMTGGLKVKHAEKSASYTLTSSDYIVGVTSVAGSKTMTLPSASSEGAGKMFMIKDQSGSASASNYIRVAAPSGQTLDGQSYYDIKVPYESVSVVSNGSHWFII